MIAFRPTMSLLVVTMLLLLGGCGGDDDGSGEARDARDAPLNQPDEPRATDATEGVTFAMTPELQACMEAAGFTQDAPPTGGLAAWRHPSGARVVVGSGQNVTNGIASEIGSDEQPATVVGSVVMAGDEEEKAAASACLA